MQGFLLLIQFMTRLPIFIEVPYDAVKIGKAIKFFPLLGFLIGGILFLVYLLVTPFIENKLIVALIIVITEILITGALHLDGLSDSFDGLFSYRNKERILEIMKDSCVGANGALVMMIYVIAKVLLLSELSWEFLFVMPVVARLNTVLHAGFGNYARESGMGKSIVDETTKNGVLFAIVSALLISFLLLQWQGFVIIFSSLVFGFISLHYIQKRIDGITGDTMGAVLELTSVVVLFVGVLLK